LGWNGVAAVPVRSSKVCWFYKCGSKQTKPLSVFGLPILPTVLSRRRGEERGTSVRHQQHGHKGAGERKTEGSLCGCASGRVTPANATARAGRQIISADPHRQSNVPGQNSAGRNPTLPAPFGLYTGELVPELQTSCHHGVPGFHERSQARMGAWRPVVIMHVTVLQFEPSHSWIQNQVMSLTNS
jgi:hypothetical protein